MKPRYIVFPTLAAAGVVLFQYFFGTWVPAPEDWNFLAAATGLRPARSPFPGWALYFVRFLCGCITGDEILRVLRVLGALSLGLSAALLAAILTRALELFVRGPDDRCPWCCRAFPPIAATCSLVALSSFPVRRLFYTFNAFALDLPLGLAVLLLAFLMLTVENRTRKYVFAGLMTGALGLLIADTSFGLPLAMLVAAVFVLWSRYSVYYSADGAVKPPADDEEEYVKTRTDLMPLFVLIVTTVVVASAGVWALIWLYGGRSGFANTECYESAVTFFAYARSGIRYDQLIVFAVLSGAAAVALIASLVYRRMFFLQYAEGITAGRAYRRLVFSIPLAFVAILVSTLSRYPEYNEKLVALWTYVSEIGREAQGCRYIFTDGVFDGAIELATRLGGGRIRALSMISDVREPYNRYLVESAVDTPVDRRIALSGVPVLLRTWVSDGSGRIDDCAVQLGFDFWRREKLEMPRSSGLLARTKGIDDAEANRAREAAHSLGERFLEVPKDSFVFSAMWRISRAAKLRAMEFERAKDSVAAQAEVAFAEKQDANNEPLNRLTNRLNQERLQTFVRFTPKEGLDLALRHGDFKQARQFGLEVLMKDENDVMANFGVGMSYLTEDQFSSAEVYLARAVEQRPNEPAILNNLAIVRYRLGKFAEAEKLAAKALELKPDQPEIKLTMAKIRDALGKDGKQQ